MASITSPGQDLRELLLESLASSPDPLTGVSIGADYAEILLDAHETMVADELLTMIDKLVETGSMMTEAIAEVRTRIHEGNDDEDS